jgi:hypothetical protein
MLVVASLFAVGCSTTPDVDATVDAATARAERVLCSNNYQNVFRLPTGGTSTVIEVRAELQTELVPDEAWRVTAVACDLSLLPANADCPIGASCASRPRPTCQQVPVGLTDTGLATATCGQTVEERDGENRLIEARTNKYRNVTFYVR